MKEDLRILKTKKSLSKTLIELLSKKSFESIKVSEICELSLINRSTFYAHYKDKYELFNDTIITLKNDLTNNLSKNKQNNTLDYILELLEIYLTHIEENKDIYLPIINHNKNGIIMDMVINALEKDITSKIQENTISKPNIPTTIIIKFYIGAIFYSGLEWLNNSQRYSKEEIISSLEYLITNGIKLQ